jgi:hypothetical protein
MTLGDSRDYKRSDLYGVRGWLAFLCVSMLIVRPIRISIIVWVVWQSPSNSTQLAGLLALIGLLALEALGLAAAVLMYRLHPLGVRLAKIFFGIRVLVGLLALFTRPDLQIVLAVGPSVAWLAYLYRSDRVRITYAPEPPQKTADVFA